MKRKKNIVLVLVLEGLVLLALFMFVTAISGANDALTNIGNAFRNFLDVPSILILLLFVMPVMIVSGAQRDFHCAFQIGKKEFSIAEMKKSLEAVQMAQWLVLCGMGFGVLISLVTVMRVCDDSLDVLGPNLAVALLILFYGTLAEAILIPLKAHVQNAITEAMDIEDEEE